MSDDGCGGAVQAPPVKPPAALSPTRLSRSDLHMQSRSHATAGQLRLPRPVTLNWDSTHPKLQCHDPLLPATYLVPATICKGHRACACWITHPAAVCTLSEEKLQFKFS
ncbi:hypothetical protein ZWY2020_037930 [Hordeum vulgare]|nr:hypothetical protein ZWY2020_037930 [Hordeum vulgare]